MQFLAENRVKTKYLLSITVKKEQDLAKTKTSKRTICISNQHSLVAHLNYLGWSDFITSFCPSNLIYEDILGSTVVAALDAKWHEYISAFSKRYSKLPTIFISFLEKNHLRLIFEELLLELEQMELEEYMSMTAVERFIENAFDWSNRKARQSNVDWSAVSREWQKLMRTFLVSGENDNEG